MAAANLIARFEAKLESKLDTQNAKIDALKATQRAEITSMRWVLGIGLAGITVVIAVIRIFS